MWKLAAERQSRSTLRSACGSLEQDVHNHDWKQDAMTSTELLRRYARFSEKSGEGSNASEHEELERVMRQVFARQLASGRFVAAGDAVCLSLQIDSRSDLSGAILALQVGLESSRKAGAGSGAQA